jgi:hypothetical protein
MRPGAFITPPPKISRSGIWVRIIVVARWAR